MNSIYLYSYGTIGVDTEFTWGNNILFMNKNAGGAAPQQQGARPQKLF